MYVQVRQPFMIKLKTDQKGKKKYLEAQKPAAEVEYYENDYIKKRQTSNPTVRHRLVLSDTWWTLSVTAYRNVGTDVIKVRVSLDWHHAADNMALICYYDRKASVEENLTFSAGAQMRMWIYRSSN